ncbi:MAG TPA: hypothetical protein VII91_00770 [Bauldia sp.]
MIECVAGDAHWCAVGFRHTEFFERAGVGRDVGGDVADGHYDPNAVDQQLGCAALVNRMALLDHSVKLN